MDDSLKTDLYELTMAAGYFHRGMSDRIATCEMFVRRLPARRRYLVAMGLERLLDYLEALRFDEAQIAWLAEIPALREAMTPALRDYLARFRFTGDVWAVPEGTAVFDGEPLVRVQAPIIEAQIVETFLLSTVNHATMIASKAARVIHAARGAKVVEFGSRRTHAEAAIDAARAAYAVGFVGTSNVEAGRRYGVPVSGTTAHMWTMAHPSEQAAFEGYVAVFPNESILLVDTYDTLVGARRAVAIAKDKLKGVRLDSGDLGYLSRAVRSILDEAGCRSASIIASGDLNEYKIAELVGSGAPIDVYGVGTELVASSDAPALGGVYKLVAITEGGVTVPVAKFSDDKATWAGAHQVFRHRRGGTLERDVIALDDEPSEGGEPLLAHVMSGGRRLSPPPKPPTTLEAIRARAAAELRALPPGLHDLEESGGERFVPRPSPRLVALTAEVRERLHPAHGA